MILKRKITYLTVSLGLILSLLLGSAAVYAFSGFGGGTQTTPFRISTCAQLGEIANNLSGSYVLNNNINCNGTTYSSPTSNFTGILNGQNHTIENINFTTCGLFCHASGGATIENTNINGGTFTDSVYGSSMGSFVGELDGATLSNLHSNLTITGSSGDQYIGGIVGLIWLGSNNSISNSSYTGSMIIPDTDAYVGGIVGYAGSTSYSLSNDYAVPTITLNSGDGYLEVGGLAGDLTEDSLTDSYSAGSITASGTLTNAEVGGFVGIFGGSATIQNSFSATSVNGSYTGTNVTAGAVYGDSGGTNTNMYFDESRAILTNCSGDNSTSCTPVNVSNANPSYFFDSKNNAPLSSWDFSNTWALSTSYPTLQNQTLFTIPSSIPNNGDANNDGQQDAFQSNVADVVDTSGYWASVSIPSSSGCIVGNSQSVSATSLKDDTGHTSLTNPVDFNIYCLTTGATVPVTIIYDRQYSNPSLVFYNIASQTYVPVVGAQFTTVAFGGVTRTEVTYSVTDGGSYDSDGIANGIIIDPVELVGPLTTTTSPVPDTGFGAPSQNNPIPYILVICAAISAVLGLGLLYRQRTK